MYFHNGFDTLLLKRAVRACMYINRILKQGGTEDFLLKQIADGALFAELDKEFEDKAEQVDVISLEENAR